MTQPDLEFLKSKVDQVVEIETLKGERLLIKVISVFDRDPDPDVFFWDVTSYPNKKDSEQSQGFNLQLHEIVSVRELANGARP